MAGLFRERRRLDLSERDVIAVTEGSEGLVRLHICIWRRSKGAGFDEKDVLCTTTPNVHIFVS